MRTPDNYTLPKRRQTPPNLPLFAAAWVALTFSATESVSYLRQIGHADMVQNRIRQLSDKHALEKISADQRARGDVDPLKELTRYNSMDFKPSDDFRALRMTKQEMLDSAATSKWLAVSGGLTAFTFGTVYLRSRRRK